VPRINDRPNTSGIIIKKKVYATPAPGGKLTD